MARVPFKLKSGNNMTGSSFKMMGSSSPLHVEEEEEVVKGETLPTVEVSGGESRERDSDKYTRVKEETNVLKGEDKLANLSKEYGGTWTRADLSERKTDKGTHYTVGSETAFVNEEGLTPKQVAISQGQEYHKKKREYKAGAQ